MFLNKSFTKGEIFEVLVSFSQAICNVCGITQVVQMVVKLECLLVIAISATSLAITVSITTFAQFAYYTGTLYVKMFGKPTATYHHIGIDINCEIGKPCGLTYRTPIYTNSLFVTDIFKYAFTR